MPWVYIYAVGKNYNKMHAYDAQHVYITKAHCKEGKLHKIIEINIFLSVLRIEDDCTHCPFMAPRTDTYVIYFRLIR